MTRQPNRSRAPLLLMALMVAACAPSVSEAQNLEELCWGAEGFMVDVVGMVAVIEPDTIDDWRTQKEVPGCTVTAAGLTDNTMRTEATLFYERVQAAGWVRTPDPRDAPAEASLRYRKDGADCLFNFYTASILGTDAEGTVTDQVIPVRGQERYHFHVMCMPAAEAAPRGG